MPDVHGQAIRRLVGPPSPEWGDRGPQTDTLREDISRWYRPAGGLGLAVFMSQVASDRNGTQPFDPNRMDEEIPVTIERMQPLMDGGWYPSSRRIAMSERLMAEPAGRQEALEHERTHALLHQAADAPIDQTTRYSANATSPDWASYIKRPSEMDVRLAAIKRRYAYHTGKIVDTPDEARKALKWYGRNHDSMDPKSEDFDANAKRAAGEYLLLPKDKRDRVLKRMTEVVNAANSGYRGAS